MAEITYQTHQLIKLNIMEEIIAAILVIAMFLGLARLFEAGVFISESLQKKEDREFGGACLFILIFLICMVGAFISKL